MSQGCGVDELGRFVQQEDLEAFKVDFSGKNGASATVCPGPVKQVTRSISKTVRSYRGNFRRLTDLVRTTIEFASFDDIRSFLVALHGRSVCSLKDFTTFWPVDDDDNDSAHETSVASENFDERCMQILRIRNRFDPALLDVPGGYRDFAIKIKIGFFIK